jgi:hypothetical protein
MQGTFFQQGKMQGYCRQNIIDPSFQYVGKMVVKQNGCHGNTCVAMATYLLPWQQISFSILTPGWNNNGIPQEFLLYPTLLPGWENGLCIL